MDDENSEQVEHFLGLYDQAMEESGNQNGGSIFQNELIKIIEDDMKLQMGDELSEKVSPDAIIDKDTDNEDS